MRCGLVTNDQGEGLVDTALGRATGVAVREVPGGCFCCRADALVAALRAIQEEREPDIYFAEPVGSCTDLVATVLRPIQEIYRLPLRVAPMTVVVDAVRFRDDFTGGRRRKGFSKGVRYIWLKQLEEAEVIVLNKADALRAGEAEILARKIAGDWPGKRIVPASTRTGEGMVELFDLLCGTEAVRSPAMEVDYALYGAGEAELGWLNARAAVSFGKADAAHDFLLRLASSMQSRIEALDVELAHLKLSLASDEQAGALAVVQSVRNGSPPEVTSRMQAVVEGGTLTVNLRAESAPAVLERVLREALASLQAGGVVSSISELQAFRPGQPKPTHRILAA